MDLLILAAAPEAGACAEDAFGLEAGAVLAAAVEARASQDAAAARELRLVCHFADLHRVPAGTGCLDPEVAEHEARADLAAHLAGGVGHAPGPAGTEGRLRLLHQGAHTIEEFALSELAAALRLSETAMRTYAGQALELRDRLPRLWDRVMAGDLPSWKARRIAAETLPLSAAAAAYVDRHLAAHVHKISLTRILRCVQAALEQHDPDTARQRAEDAAERRGVWLEDRVDGTTEVRAVTSTPDAHDLDRAVCDLARIIGQLGNTDSHDVRRAAALGLLADPQHVLHLQQVATDHPDNTDSAVSRGRSGRGREIAIHLHLDPHDVLSAGARVEGLGPRARAALESWFANATPTLGAASGVRVSLRTVIDLNAEPAVDAYEIPQRIQEQVGHRDLTCQFPWCGRVGAYDLDHLEPWVHPDDGGPPGQTTPDNLARLCRYHHRVKTHHPWTVQRTPEAELIWSSPHGRLYRVGRGGTTNLTPPA